MKRNFYLQHPLMAMYDPRMQTLLDKEGPKGIGAYWIIIEKLSLLPDSRAKLEYLRPYCKGKKLPFAYLKKIIFGFQLFILEEDGFFSPEELNPVKKKEKKTVKNDRANAFASAKNDENRPKTAEENMDNKQANALETSTNKVISREVFKENIKDIITSSSTKEKETADDTCNATLEQPESHSSTGQMPHLSKANATLQTRPSVAFASTKCGISDAEMWHFRDLNYCLPDSSLAPLRKINVVAPIVTIAPSSMRIRSLSPRISLFRKVPVRLGASRNVYASPPCLLRFTLIMQWRRTVGSTILRQGF